MQANGNRLDAFGSCRGIQSSASGNNECHFSKRQICSLVGATRYLTGPDALMRSSTWIGTETGEFTHNEPSASLTMIMRVGRGTPKTRTGGLSTIDMFSANCLSSDIFVADGRISKEMETPLHCIVRR
jgi:hypothetical protein